MHMADALLSPAVGGTLWAASSGTIAYCSAKVRKELDDRKVPLMGVLGAFLFAAQMINFSIPGTGSSGHLGGGLLLTILLGPHAAFLTLASVLIVQALFFADGGLLALGCNIFNLGFFPAFVAYPYIYKKIAGERPGRPGSPSRPSRPPSPDWRWEPSPWCWKPSRRVSLRCRFRRSSSSCCRSTSPSGPWKES